MSLNTSTAQTQPRDLGLFCGNTSATTRWAPQQVVAYEVPGTGEVEVRFTTINSSTSANFNTVVQARTECDVAPTGPLFPPVCFDDSFDGANVDGRAAGTVLATGGETLFFYVTGFSDPPSGTDRGAVTLELFATQNTTPTLTDAACLVFGDAVTIQLTGNDPDNDVRGVLLNVLDDNGVIDIYGDGVPSLDQDVLGFDIDAADVQTDYGANPPFLFIDLNTTFRNGNGDVEIPGDVLNPSLGAFLTNPAIGATRVRVRTYDDAFAVSQDVTVPIEIGARVGFGETCGAGSLCESPYVCGDDDRCGASAGAIDTCDNAVININDSFTVVPDSYNLITVEGEIPGGPSFFGAPECVEPTQAEASEAVYELTLPAGNYDLIVNTDTDLTGDLDTLVSLRQTCINPLTERECANDVGDTNVQARLEERDLVQGTYFILVERFTETAVLTRDDFSMDIEVRPILPAGSPCDILGVMNRCEAGTLCSQQGDLIRCF